MSRSLFKRAAVLLEINLDDLLMDAADPNAAAADYLAEMERGLAQAKNAVAAEIAKGRQIERQLAEARASGAEWDAKADAALRAGDEEQARLALKRKLFYQHRLEELQEELDRHTQTVAEMKTSLSGLQAKAEDVRQRREQLAAEHK